MIRLLFSRSALALAISCLFVVAAPAAFAGSYGDFSSPTGTVTFRNVTDLNDLFGAPTVSANTLDFTPVDFETTCSGSCGAGTSVSDTLTFQIDSDAGYFIEDIILSEAGDTLINDFSIPIGFAATTIVGNVVIDVLELDNSTVNGINGNAQMVFTEDGTYDTSNEGNGTYGWTGQLALDIDALIAGAGQTGRATLVQISLVNTLTAFAENGAVAIVEKKDADGLAITVVPEPGTALLFALGLGGLSIAGRSRRREA